MDDKIDQLLVANGLEIYVPQFRDHAIRSDVFADLTAEDLLEAGVTSLGHRIRLLRLIEDSKAQSSSSAPSSEPSSASRLASAPPSAGSLSAPNMLPYATGSTPPSATPSTGPSASLSATSSTSQGATSSTNTPASGANTVAPRDAVYLKQRIDTLEKQVRRLHELVTRLRADMFRQRKEGEPLPTPGRSSPTGSTANSGTLTAGSKSLGSAVSVAGSGATTPGGGGARKSPFEGYFSRPAQFPGSALPSPSAHPSSAHPSSLLITTQSDLTKNYRCSEHDNTVRFLSVIHAKNNLEGDATQWRLEIQTGKKTRELLDHEYPLKIFKQMQEQGYKPVFAAKHTQPHKPPSGSFI